MPINDELYKQAMVAITTAEDASGVKADSGPDKDVGDEAPTPGNVDPASDQAAQAQLTPEEVEKLRSFMTPQQGIGAAPTWSPFEHRQFTRLGMDPGRLNFFQALSGLRKGMNLENELLDRALSGQRQEFSDVDELPLGKYS